jgi:hypothetical protein
MNKQEKQELDNLIKTLDYLEAKHLIYCLSILKPSINQEYTYITFKIPKNN